MRFAALLSSLLLSLVAGLCMSPFLMSLTVYLPSAYQSFIVTNIPHIAILCFLFLFVRILCKEKMISIFTDSGHFSGRKFLIGLASALPVLLLQFLGSSYSYFEAPLSQRFIFLILVLLITPLQCLCEELMTRCMIARLFVKNYSSCKLYKKIALILFSGTLFFVLHLANNEFSLSRDTIALALYYFLFGALAMLLIFVSGGSEAVFGIHVMNNVFVALVMNYEGSPLETAPLFMRNTIPSPLLEVFLLIFIFSLSSAGVTFASSATFRKVKQVKDV